MCASSAVIAYEGVSPVSQPVTGEPIAIPTFHALGLYWSPPGGAPDQTVEVRYRPQGASEWRRALDMRFNPIAEVDRGLPDCRGCMVRANNTNRRELQLTLAGDDLADYRGSIVHLDPATTYEIQLTLAVAGTSATFTATTWSEDFPVGETIKVGDRVTPLIIDESGSPGAWRLYDGRGATIDVRHQHEACIEIKASFVIVRGFTLRGAGKPANVPRGTTGAIVIHGGQDIVIEECDISDWGRFNAETGFGKNMDSAVYSRNRTLARLVVQHCKVHHPAFDTNTWYEPEYPTHPAGPQGITLYNSAGNNVIRYNEFWSDMDHMFNDIIGGGSNVGFRGAPGPDSDIYGNFVSHSWDDGLEIEGGSRNVRVWDNYITQCMMMIGNAPASIGPLYIWRNVVVRSQWQPDFEGGYFLKMGYAAGEQWMTGHQYVFHNTIFGADEYLPTGGLGGGRIAKHTVSRNNILHVREPEHYSVSDNERNVGNDFDYDLYNGRIPGGHEANGLRGVPVYAPNTGFGPVLKTGRFYLAPDSPGAAAGEPIPNFTGKFAGTAPDMGAHQRGAPAINYGIKADARAAESASRP